MERRPSGIPTVYKGIQFRSRLEARWAAMFDLLGWTYQYEPFDLPGWIPDFQLGRGKLLVEVKPTAWLPRDVAAEIDACSEADDYEILLLGCTLPRQPWNVEMSDGIAIGWIRSTPMSWCIDQSKRWCDALVQVFDDPDEGTEFATPSRMNRPGLFSSVDHLQHADPGAELTNDHRFDFAFNRMDGFSKPRYWGIGDPDRNRLEEMWVEAGNLTQWKGRQSVTR